MFQSVWCGGTSKRTPSSPHGRGLRIRSLRLEILEDRTVPSVAVSASAISNVFEGQPNLGLQVATFTDSATSLTAGQFNVTINYGDGTSPVTTINPAPNGSIFDSNLLVAGSAGTFTITDNHTFPEESGSTVPPFAFTVTITVTEKVSSGLTGTGTSQAFVLDAALAPGNPITAGTPTVFTGGTAALTNFEAAVGGSKNTLTAPQPTGFRTITWDGVKVDGSDAVAGTNSTVVITPGHTVGIPLNRFQNQGVFFGAVYAVSNDGFGDVNPSVGNPNPVLFPAFSAPNTFAMFNDNGIDFKFVVPASPTTPPVSAVSRGFGAIFLNVQQPGTTIQYFHGSTLLDTLNVPTNGSAGAAVFAGELFNNAIVTNVLLTLGQGVIFRFDGTTVTPGGANSTTNNLVATDDFVYAEPQPAANGFPIVSGAQGTLNAQAAVIPTVATPFTGVVATFSDSDPNGNANDFTATINWGDGHFSNGTITKNAQGGFDVSGTNTYAVPVNFTIDVDIADFGGGPGLNGSQPTLSINNTAHVSAGDQNHRFVAQVYLDLLHRIVDASGLQFWGGVLDAGTMNRTQVVQGIESSLEYRVVEVNAAYQQILGRPADPTGLGNFVQFLQSGGSVEQLKAILGSSQEFINDAQAQDTTAGLTTANQKFVDFLFQKVFNRPADSGGLNAFTTALGNGASPLTVASVILTSLEAQTDQVRGFYQQFLKRPADNAGLNSFAQSLVNGASDEAVIAALVSSAEYLASV
ncbi:MAG TPA: DUF4214 domain-containing protein [Gemmataceae bacterium]|nr:DUF4214 domain-containing protein [Gemmataceae bacterium]